MMRIALEREITEILERLNPARFAQRARGGVAPKHLDHLEVEQVGRMERLTGREEALGHAGRVRRVQEQLENGRGINNNHP